VPCRSSLRDLGGAVRTRQMCPAGKPEYDAPLHHPHEQGETGIQDLALAAP
jgi:hypothetical protein